MATDQGTATPYTGQAEVAGPDSDATGGFTLGQHGLSGKSCGVCYATKEAVGAATDGPGDVVAQATVDRESARMLRNFDDLNRRRDEINRVAEQVKAFGQINRPDGVPESTRAEVERMNPEQVTAAVRSWPRGLGMELHDGVDHDCPTCALDRAKQAVVDAMAEVYTKDSLTGMRELLDGTVTKLDVLIDAAMTVERERPEPGISDDEALAEALLGVELKRAKVIVGRLTGSDEFIPMFIPQSLRDAVSDDVQAARLLARAARIDADTAELDADELAFNETQQPETAQ